MASLLSSAISLTKNLVLTRIYNTAIAFLAGSIATLAIVCKYHNNDKSQKRRDIRDLPRGAQSIIGNTPIIELPTISAQLGNVKILAKCEHLNPGGSPKDRVAKSILDTFERTNIIKPYSNYTIYEGTVGSTGISLAWQCRARGYNCVICMPSDVATEKVTILKNLGAQVQLVKPCGIVDEGHYVNVARRMAKEDARGVFADQFENLANFAAHYERTGVEIYEQTDGGKFDYLVLGGGTCGTIAGCARFLKSQSNEETLQVILADPQGSGLYNKINHGVFYTSQESEGKRRRHQIDSAVEGVGITRMTKNLEMVLGKVASIKDSRVALRTLESGEGEHDVQMDDFAINWINEAIGVTDREAVCMSRYLARHEGLFLGSSSCVNLVACVKLSRRLSADQQKKKKPVTIVTMLCDSGQRHQTKFWNEEYLVSNGILQKGELVSSEFQVLIDTLGFVEP